VLFRTRNGKTLELPHHVDQFKYHKNKAFDGEAIIVINDTILPRKEGNGILNSIQKGSSENTENVVLVLWDMMDFDKFLHGLDDTPYETRWSNLVSVIKSLPGCKLQDSYRVDTMEEVFAIYEKMRAEGKEGIILKNPSSPYEAKRVTHQLKFKAENDGDFRIMAVEEGTGKYEGMMGNLVIQTSDGMLMSSVGTGFTDGDRQWFWTNKDSLIGKICTVRYNEIIKSRAASKPASLFLPVFVELRTDKDVPNSIGELK
jgi:DNA ligase-1